MELFPAAAPPSLPLAQSTHATNADVVRAFGAHPLMESVQATLRVQLTEALLRADAELTAVGVERERTKREREDLGVELYDVQQQLASLQVAVETASADSGTLRDARERLESEAAEISAAVSDEAARVKQGEASLSGARVSLEAATNALRSSEAAAAAAAAAAALRRRIASKAEETVAEKEAAKSEQDLLVDTLMRAVLRNRDELALYTSQTSTFELERTASNATIAEGEAELESIAREKTRLLTAWDSSLVAVRKRDDALGALRSDIAAAAADRDAMSAEEGSLTSATTAAQSEHAALRGRLDKEETQNASVEAGCAELRRSLAGLAERAESLTGTVAATNAEVARASAEAFKLSKRLSEVNRSRLLLDKRRAGMEDEIAEKLDGRVVSSRATQASARDSTKLLAGVRAAEAVAAGMEADIAAAHLQALTLTASIGRLQTASASANADVAAAEALLARYEGEAAARQEAISKKVAVLDRLNRAYERLRSAAIPGETPQDAGPLRAEITNLERSAAGKREAVEALQRRWLADQTALVATTAEGEALEGRVRDLRGQVEQLRAKQCRLDTAIEGQRGEAGRLVIAVGGMHKDLGRINALIARNGTARDALRSASLTARRTFNEELRAAEREAAEGDARVRGLRAELTRLSEEGLELEKQALLWERRARLERELQALCDPTEGQGELASLGRDVARMRERREALRRDAERVVGELKRAVAKRDDIANQHAATLSVTLAAAATSGRGAMRATSAAAAAAAATTLGGGTGLLSRSGSGRGSVSSASSPRSQSATPQQQQQDSSTRTGTLSSPVLASSSSSDAAVQTRVGLAQRAAALRRELNEKQVAIAAALSALESSTAEAASTAAVLASRTAEVGALESKAGELQKAIRASAFERQRASETASALTRYAARLGAIARGKLPRLSRSEAAKATRALSDALAGRDAVEGVVASLIRQHDTLRDALRRIASLLHVADAVVDAAVGSGGGGGGAAAL